MTFFPLFQWLGNTWIGVEIQRSTWGVAIAEMVHLLALATLGGTILLVDLRLFGIGMKRQPAARLARDLSPLFWGSLAVMLVSGVIILSGEPMKCYYSPVFRIKMLLLLIAILFQSTFHRSALASATGKLSPVWSKSAATLSLALWLSVGLAGRAIGYF
jgi:hypothetical protein